MMVISYIIVGGISFIAGKHYGYWSVRRLLGKDWVKRELTNEIKRGLEEIRISRYKKYEDES